MQILILNLTLKTKSFQSYHHHPKLLKMYVKYKPCHYIEVAARLNFDLNFFFSAQPAPPHR